VLNVLQRTLPGKNGCAIINLPFSLFCIESNEDTADIFTEIPRGIDKWLWFVEVHFQASK